MTDHWKSLANQLGAPGVDEPAEEEVVEEAAPKEAAPTEKAAKEDTASEPQADFADDVQPEQAETSEASQEEPAVQSEAELSVSFKQEDPAPIADEENEKSTPEVIQAVAPRSSKRDQPPAEEKPKRKKRRTSWDMLASMFNVSNAAEPSPEADDQEDREAASQTLADSTAGPSAMDEDPTTGSADEDSGEDSPTLAIFDETTETDENPALESMFADVPRDKDLSWNSKRRMVDDVGWEEGEVEEIAETDEEEDSTESSAKSESARDSDRGEDGGRRGRSRRRRRGRRGRGSDFDRAESPERDDREPDPVEGELSDEAASDNWSDVSDFEDDDDEVQEVERRSNRRRRRGRGRGDRDQDAVSDAEVKSEEFSADVEESEESDDLDPGPRRRRSRQGERAERGQRPPRSRSERSGRGGPSSERDEVEPRRKRSVPDSDSDDDSSDAPKHRNIPSWNDALQTIIETNVDNRKRNDSRGGNRGRRGRR